MSAATPATAFAETPEIAGIKSRAQIETDGALRIAEQRTFLFSQSHSIVAWPVTGLGSKSELNVSSIRFAPATPQGGIASDWVSLASVACTSEMRELYTSSKGYSARVEEAAEAMQDASYTDDNPLPDVPAFAKDTRYGVIYLFLPQVQGRIVIDADYTITNATRVFDDVAELYWDYLPGSIDLPIRSANVVLQLPVPKGVDVLPYENVEAWGHGAQGTVDVRKDGTIAFRVPVLEAGQYAQAHVVFPQKWLTNVSLQTRSATSGTRLDAARSEELYWTDTWSAWLVNSLSVNMAVLVVSVLALAVAFAMLLLYGREHPPALSPASEKRAAHGALSALTAYTAPVIGRLRRWNHQSPDDFVAALIQLIANHAILVDVVQNNSSEPLGAGYPNLRFKSGKRAKEFVRTPAQQELFRLLFDVWGEGYMSVTLDDICTYAHKYPGQFRQQMNDWQNALTQEINDGNFYDTKSARVQKKILILGCVLGVAAILFGVLPGSVERGWSLGISAAGCLLIGNYLNRRTPLGLEAELISTSAADALNAFDSLSDIPASLVAYAFELHVKPADHAANSPVLEDYPESLAAYWLAPRVGRGGKRISSLAVQMSNKIDEWS